MPRAGRSQSRLEAGTGWRHELIQPRRDDSDSDSGSGGRRHRSCRSRRAAAGSLTGNVSRNLKERYAGARSESGGLETGKDPPA